MRSKLFVCAALAGTCLLGTWSPVARAADPKAKGKKAKSGDSLSDDKVMSKQMQWEDSVMGPDDKRGELDKIARAQAINKAAAEKAAKEKEKADAQAAKEAAAPSRKPASAAVTLRCRRFPMRTLVRAALPSPARSRPSSRRQLP